MRPFLEVGPYLEEDPSRGAPVLHAEQPLGGRLQLFPDAFVETGGDMAAPKGLRLLRRRYVEVGGPRGPTTGRGRLAHRLPAAAVQGQGGRGRHGALVEEAGISSSSTIGFLRIFPGAVPEKVLAPFLGGASLASGGQWGRVLGVAGVRVAGGRPGGLHDGGGNGLLTGRVDLRQSFTTLAKVGRQLLHLLQVVAGAALDHLVGHVHLGKTGHVLKGGFLSFAEVPAKGRTSGPRSHDHRRIQGRDNSDSVGGSRSRGR